MYHASAQGVDECMINIHYYHYYNDAAGQWRTAGPEADGVKQGGEEAAPETANQTTEIRPGAEKASPKTARKAQERVWTLAERVSIPVVPYTRTAWERMVVVPCTRTAWGRMVIVPCTPTAWGRMVIVPCTRTAWGRKVIVPCTRTVWGTIVILCMKE